MARRPGAPDWIEEALLRELDGGLWHATDAAGWRGIRATGSILPAATINFPHSFCRSMGAISLFDLSYPDSDVSPAATHWSAWLVARDGGPSFWIEVDRVRSANQLLDPDALLARWRTALAAHSRDLRIIAHIEAAHLGSLRLVDTRRVLKIASDGWVPVAR